MERKAVVEKHIPAGCAFATKSLGPLPVATLTPAVAYAKDAEKSAEAITKFICVYSVGLLLGSRWYCV